RKPSEARTGMLPTVGDSSAPIPPPGPAPNPPRLLYASPAARDGCSRALGAGAVAGSTTTSGASSGSGTGPGSGGNDGSDGGGIGGGSGTGWAIAGPVKSSAIPASVAREMEPRPRVTMPILRLPGARVLKTGGPRKYA